MQESKNCRHSMSCAIRGKFFLALFFLLAWTGKIQAQPFPEIVPNNIVIPSGTTQNTFGYIGKTTSITGAGSASSTLSGHTITTTGNGSDTPLFIYSPSNETASGAVASPTAYAVTVSGLTVSNGLSQGGNSSFGGGGAGLGGAAFVGAGVTLTLSNVNVTGNRAAGGNAGVSGGLGGGGIGGTSTSTSGGGLFVNNADSGSAGFGGGGGYNSGSAYTGGFGGGGGFGHNGGNGGFGGGGGGRTSGNGSGPGGGGLGGGRGSNYVNAYGGGGAGFGGGLFVQNSAAVIVTGNSTISGNTVTAGRGADGGVNGAAAGSDIFMMVGGTVALAPGTGNTVTIGAAADDANDVVSDVADTSSYSVSGGSGGATLTIGNASTPGGTVILHGNNTYAGDTSISNGVTLEVFQGDNLGASLTNSAVGAVTLSDGEILTGATGFNTPRTITLGTGTDTLAAVTGTTATYSGVISGAALTVGDVNNAGTVILNSANSYTGGTTLETGTLVIGNNTALGTGTLTTIDPTVVYMNGINMANPIVMQGDTTLEVDNTDSATQSGAISESGGSYAVTKTGTGTLALTVANTYTGGTTIDAGVLDAENNSALGTGAVTVNSGGSLQVGGASVLANNITISGTGTGGAGAIFASDGLQNEVNGNVTLAADSSVDVTLNNIFLNGTVSLGAYELTLGGAGLVDILGHVTGTGGIVVAANGAALVSSPVSNTYTGLTTVEAGAVLTLGDFSGAIAVPGDLDISGTVDEVATGQLAATTVVTLSGSGQFDFDSYNASETIAGLNGTSGTLVSPGFEGGGNTLTLSGAGTYLYAGQINDASMGVFGPANIALVKQGSGSQELDGANSYSGGTTLTSGTLIAGNSAAFGTGLLQVNGGTLQMGNNNHVISVGSYAQTGGTLYLNLIGPGQQATADMLQVTNLAMSQATLGGNLTVNLANFVSAPLPGLDRTYTFTVVAAGGGYNGTFASLTPINNGGFTATLDYAGDDVLLQIVQGAATFVLTGLTPNQQAIGGNINNTITSGGTSPLIVALGNAFVANPGALGTYLDELSPQKFGQFASTTAFNNASFATEAMDNYLAGQRGGPHGTFIGGNGGIDSSGLVLNDPYLRS